MAEFVHLSERVSTTLTTYQGCISVAPTGRYFQDERGQGFVVVGQNDAISWPVALLDGTSRAATEDYVKDLRAHGVNVSRVMMEYAERPHQLYGNVAWRIFACCGLVLGYVYPPDSALWALSAARAL
jgi:hypothetical protein